MATDKAKPDKFWISRIKNLNVFNMAWPDNCSRVMMRCGCADLYFGWKAKAPLLPSPEYRPPLQKLNTPMDAIAQASSWCAIKITEEKGDVGKLDGCQWLLLEDQYQYWQCWQYQYLTDVKYTMHASLYDVYVESIHWMQRFYERRYKEFSYNMYILVKVNVYQSYQTSPH